jgi:hypothetical protein
MEAERVWGYDVGWKLCSELQASGQKASMTSSTTPSRSLCVAATQTDPVAIPPLNWAEDTGVLPIIPPPVHHLSQPSTLCDFLALSTGIMKPFASLQRCHHCSPRLHITPQSRPSRPISIRRQNNHGYPTNPQHLQHSWCSHPPSFLISSLSMTPG